ncbi:S8 family serine peptidase [Micromonospora sp. NPDC006431]|uniref:S8 family serine peptidase n=1 Tax=Micromonospora sp. NPDC006431 TaxID=3364235 RepID=UPI0036B7DB4F
MAVLAGGIPDDCQGHGTALAGIVGGQLHGVAKDARLVPVRVLGCTGAGTTAQVIAGVDWVTANARGTRALVNMGVGSSPSTSLDNAVTNSINSGIPYVVRVRRPPAPATTHPAGCRPPSSWLAPRSPTRR